MGAYKYIAETLQKQYKARDADYRAKIIAWRAGPAMVRVERPANLARARKLGYQAKQGYAIVRTRVDKGRRTRRRSNGGRKHKNYYMFVQPQMSHRAIAEQRVNRLYRNMEVLNSYWVGEDGNYKFFEVILADASKPSVNVSSVMRQGKAFRGLTAAGNSRGASKKKGLNKKLQRKALSRQAYHFKPYVKKVAVPKAEAKPKPAAPKHETHPHTPAHAQHPAHSTQHAAHGAEHHAHSTEHTHPHSAEHPKHDTGHAHQHPAHGEHQKHETHPHPEHAHEHKPAKKE